jgi:hypothetical protein
MMFAVALAALTAGVVPIPTMTATGSAESSVGYQSNNHQHDRSSPLAVKQSLGRQLWVKMRRTQRYQIYAPTSFDHAGFSETNQIG